MKDTLAARGLPDHYAARLKFELAEVKKQGAEMQWLDFHHEHARFASNPNNLMIPWLLGMVDEDPLAGRATPMVCSAKARDINVYRDQHGRIPHDMIRDSDTPDIDIDCLPEMRDELKQYAFERYSKSQDQYGSVCSVGTIQTYKFKLALQDVVKALGDPPPSVVTRLNNQLPEDVNTMVEGGVATCKQPMAQTDGTSKPCGTKYTTAKCPKCGEINSDNPSIGQMLAEHEMLATFNHDHETVVNYALGLIGRVRALGMHAGALIIADRPLFGNVPMAKTRQGMWTSMWTEGRSTQLSKFGYIKWDWLGLKTLKYIYRCCQLIKENRGIDFGDGLCGLDDNNPREDRAGHFFGPDGTKHIISLNDPDTLDLINQRKGHAVFQHDTRLAMDILRNGVRSFLDEMALISLGHPGPMAAIPTWVANRDDKTGSWKKGMHPDMVKILQPTHGVIITQEQLAAIWQRFAGFTVVEAQKARKAVAKKYGHEFEAIEKKWMIGATKTLGAEEAKNMWAKMASFARYAFNAAHAVQYALTAYQCWFLKTHFAPEYWAAVMSDCHPEKLIGYMNVARVDGWKPTATTQLGTHQSDQSLSMDLLNINNLSEMFTVSGNSINPGLMGIKGVGDSAAKAITGRHNVEHLDQFISIMGAAAKKPIVERLIKLGAFKHLPHHGNARAVWHYYLSRYAKDKEIKAQVEQALIEHAGWTAAKIAAEQQRLVDDYKKLYPKRKTVPKKVTGWTPEPSITMENVGQIFPDDFSLMERLDIQKTFLGYYIDSPLDRYERSPRYTIANVRKVAGKKTAVKLHCLVQSFAIRTSQNGNEYGRLEVSDGDEAASVFIWMSDLNRQDKTFLAPGSGVQLVVKYDEERESLSLDNGSVIIPLKFKHETGQQ
jgi:DNA polymerase III alpha subunit